METSQEIRVFQQITISTESKTSMIQTLLDLSTRKLEPTDPSDITDLKDDVLNAFLGK